jgi:hypothetical protein
MQIPIIGAKQLLIQVTLEIPPGVPDQGAAEAAIRALSFGVTVAPWVREVSASVMQPASANGPKG